MIGKLRGVVDVVGVDHAVIDVGGVGYEVTCSSKTLSALPQPGQQVTLSIETHVREDAIKLFGFLSEAERGWFRLLQSVQGIGAKMALSILNALDCSQLANAIALQDKTTITRAPGVGPKVAFRIVNELKDKVPPLAISAAAAIKASPGSAGGGALDGRLTSAPVEAVSALINLGYAAQQANAAVAAAAQKAGETPRTEDLIRLSLKELAA